MTTSISYNHIFKTTFLFGFVQVFNIIVKIGTNKAIAIFLGAEGMGIVSLLSSTINLLKTGCGLGISQSCIRDISELQTIDDKLRLSRSISNTKKIILYTGLFGSFITLILSPWLSEWTFGDRSFTLAFVWLSLVVGMNILMEGQLAILTGMRQLRSLAKASMIGSAIGLVTVVPFYYFFAKSGIVPSLIIIAFSSLFFSNYFVGRIKYESPKLKLKELFNETSPMLKMGIALMLSSFFYFITSLIISTFIRRFSGLAMVGYYQAGVTIISGYFGIIISAITTDYYPRIAALNKNNLRIKEELNKQTIVSLILTGPLIVTFIFLLSFFVKLLYSESFMPAADFVKFAVFGILIRICSNQVEMILVAKVQIRVYIILQISYRLIEILLNIYLFKIFGLKGIGVSYIITGIIHFIIMQITVYKLYRIRYNLLFVKISTIVFFLTMVAALISNCENEFLRYFLGINLTVLALSFSLILSKKVLRIDPLGIISKRISEWATKI